MATWKIILIVMAGILLIFLLGLCLDYFFSIKWFGVIQPARENVKREVFENTKSYIHGKVQDLSRYYEQYQKAEVDETEPIRQIILMQFANFDAGNIDNQTLKRFLISVRGY